MLDVDCTAKVLGFLSHSCEILILPDAGLGERAASVDGSGYCTPSLGRLTDVSMGQRAANIIKEGPSWIKVDHRSGLPRLGIFDAARVSVPDGTPRLEPRIFWFGKRGRKIPPMQIPCILPPLARYVDGVSFALAKYSIGGYTSAITADTPLVWPIQFEVSTEELVGSDDGTLVYQGYFNAAVTADVQSDDIDLYGPAFAEELKRTKSSGSVSYRGDLTMNGLSALHNVNEFFRPIAMSGGAMAAMCSSGDTDVSYIQQNLSSSHTTGFWWHLLWQLDYIAPDGAGEDGLIPAYHAFKVEI